MDVSTQSNEYKKLGYRFLRDAFLLLIVVGVLDLIGIKLYFFWTLHNYDSVVHFLAGITVGLGSLWLWLQLPILSAQTELTRKRIFWVALIGACIVGVIWEIFEVTNGITFLSDGIHYFTDTSSDLLMDVCGGLVAGWYAWRVVLKRGQLKNNG